MGWRAMQAEDLGAVAALAAAIHPAHPEDPDVFAERLCLYPQGCIVLIDAGAVVGYALAHPWLRAAPPALNTRLVTLPTRADCLYLHDIAVLRASRGRGAARAALALLAGLARGEGLPLLALIAIPGTRDFWRRQGFAVVPRPALAAKLASYGPGARFMERAA